MRSKQHLLIIGYALLHLALACAQAQGVDVTAQVVMQDKTAAKHKHPPNLADVVVWLTPLQPDSHPASTGHPGPFRLVQKDKQFTPHLLVVPNGSSVEFPNHDPFFHNVFSLFNGKRFDLGLYESGSSRSVRFDRKGVSYIFCNIHPEMGAIVVSLGTPYYGVSNATGAVSIHDVPAGSYHLNVWGETSQSANPVDTDRVIQVGATPVRLGEIVLQTAADPMAHHKNKFGEDYRPTNPRPY